MRFNFKRIVGLSPRQLSEFGKKLSKFARSLKTSDDSPINLTPSARRSDQIALLEKREFVRVMLVFSQSRNKKKSVKEIVLPGLIQIPERQNVVTTISFRMSAEAANCT